MCGVTDVLDYSSFPTVVQWVEQSLAPNEGLNVLINNAAVASWGSSSLPVPREVMMSDLELNAVAPFMLTQVGCIFLWISCLHNFKHKMPSIVEIVGKLCSRFFIQIRGVV